MVVQIRAHGASACAPNSSGVHHTSGQAPQVIPGTTAYFWNILVVHVIHHSWVSLGGEVGFRCTSPGRGVRSVLRGHTGHLHLGMQRAWGHTAEQPGVTALAITAI